MPRPGTGLPIEFASTIRAMNDPDLLENFIIHILGFSGSAFLLISDESAIRDFGDDEGITEICRKIELCYGCHLEEQ
jgi:hypothetical protein